MTTPNAADENLQKSMAEETRPEPSSASANAAGAPDMLAITIHAKTGQIVRIEAVTASGERQELSDDAKAAFASDKEQPTIAGLVEEAFQAGIDCVFVDRQDQAQEPVENLEESAFRHVLLQELIKGGAAERLMRPEVLRRAIVATLISQSLGQ